jgi:glutathione S-transferase
MILYGHSASPFARKVLMFAAEKGIVLENPPFGPHHEDAGFREASPFGKIPAFRDGDFTLADSTAIVTYLEAKFPDPPMIPLEPRARARAIWFEEFSDTVIFPPCTKMFYNRILAPRIFRKPGNQELADAAQANEIPPVFAYLESVMCDNGFLVGDTLTIADIAVVNQLVNIEYSSCPIDATRYPKLAAYYARHKVRPSIAATIAIEKAQLGIEGEQHA